MTTKLVGLMARYPEHGRVKTRLANSVGNDKALAIYNNILEHTIRQCQPQPGDDYQLCCFVTPPHLADEFANNFPELSECFPQSEGLLGTKMENAFTRLLGKSSTEKTILIGADIPGLSRELILAAFKELDHCEVVWGPTTDGGYYLIGMKGQVNRALLNDRIPWGTDQVLKTSLETVKKSKIKYRLLPTLDDLDDIEDLNKFPEFDK